jgi:hypothetical protein
MTCHRYISRVRYSIAYASAPEIDIVRLSVYSYNTPNSKSQIILVTENRFFSRFTACNVRDRHRLVPTPVRIGRIIQCLVRFLPDTIINLTSTTSDLSFHRATYSQQKNYAGVTIYTFA